MTVFLGFTQRNNFGDEIYPIRPMGVVQNLQSGQVDAWRPTLGLPFSAWSVARRVYSNYSGPLIEVRRNSDNATQNIGYNNLNQLDTDSLSSFIGVNSGFIRTIYDQSGRANDFVQTSLANQPRIVNAGTLDTRNGLPSAFFDGVNDRMDSGLVGTFKWMHDTDDANFTQQILSVAQFGTSANPGVDYFLIGNNGGASAQIGYSQYWQDSGANNNRPVLFITRGVGGTSVVNMGQNNALTPNQLITWSTQTNRGNATAANRAYFYINQSAVINVNTQTSATNNGNAGAVMQLGSDGFGTSVLLGYFSEMYFYRQSSNTIFNLSTFNQDLQTYYGI